MVREMKDDLVVVGTSAASAERRRALEKCGVTVLTFDGRGGRADLRRTIAWLGERKCLSLMIEAGSKINWSALDSGMVDKVFFYYGMKILGGVQALPMAGGIGRRRRADAILVRNVTLHRIPPDEFAVEGYLCSPAS
jgi:diaminohydroxyphosphoribosylaminopyrimidine deaminase / 5-amino-6-(5-phosphoribosylamino)uracil reductase